MSQKQCNIHAIATSNYILTISRRDLIIIMNHKYPRKYSSVIPVTRQWGGTLSRPFRDVVDVDGVR